MFLPHKSTLYREVYQNDTTIFDEVIANVESIGERRKLVSHGNFSGKTPLHEACDIGRGKVLLGMKLVEELDAKRLKKDSWGKTPLHYAAKHCLILSARVLLQMNDKSADGNKLEDFLNITDKFGLWPVDYAIQNWKKAENNVQNQASSRQTPKLRVSDYEKMAKYLVHPNLVDASVLNKITELKFDWEGKSILHLAVEAKNTEQIRRFLSPSLRQQFQDDYDHLETSKRGMFLLTRFVAPHLEKQLLDEFSELPEKDQQDRLWKR